jgi:predicted PurR-regulated permease PerM
MTGKGREANMRDPVKTKYIRWGVTLFSVIAASIVLAMILSRLSGISSWVANTIAAVSPVIWGLVIAFIVNPIAVFFEDTCFRLFKNRMKPRTASKLAHALSIVFTVLFTVLVIFGVIMLIVPQLTSSISVLIENGQDYYNTLEEWINTLLEDNPKIRDYVETILEKGYAFLEDWVNNRLVASAQSIMSKVASGVFSVVRWIANFLIGIIIAAYMLADKKRLLAQCRKLSAAIWKPKAEARIKRVAHKANEVFGGFIRGKLLDSTIIGILCYIGALILKLPYPILVATIVGITNIVPFFGPLIGAIPCALIILLIDPIKCLYFCIFILALQQLDGNVIGPKILGNTVGISSFWVLISITVFSGLFGVIGMLIGVPLFAVLYTIVKDLAEEQLTRKKLPTDTLAYMEPWKTSQFISDQPESHQTMLNVQEEPANPDPLSKDQPET